MVKLSPHEGPMYLAQRFEFGFHNEVEFTEFTAACIRGFNPLVETGLVDKAQASCAATRRNQPAVVVPLTVADPTHNGHVL